MYSSIINAIESEVAKPKKMFVTATELLEKGLVNVPKLIDPILQKVGVVAVVGSSDTGKSAFLRQLSIAIATKQKTFLDFPINAKYHKGIYVSSEDDENSIASLLYKYNQEAQLEFDQFSGLRYVFDTENLLITLDSMLSEEKVDLIVIDAFADLYNGQMNEGNKVRGYLNEFNQLAQRHECLIVFLHHVGKRTEEQAPSKSNIVGSQSFEAKMRLVLELRKDYHDPNLRHLCIIKGNYLSSEYKKHSYVLNFDSNMVFHYTGQRVAFEHLVKPSIDKESIQHYKNLKDLLDEGYTQNKAAEKLGISKGQASKVLKKHKIELEVLEQDHEIF